MGYHHVVLGVPQHASSREVRAAYLRQAAKLHPDKGESRGRASRFLHGSRPPSLWCSALAWDAWLLGCPHVTCHCSDRQALITPPPAT